MNIIAWLSLFASIICLLLGIIVYSFNRKSILNQVFIFTALTAFVYSFTTVMMWAAADFASANFWNKMGTIWPFFVALVLNFALVFTESNWIKNKLNYLFLYLPAVSFFLIDLFSNLIIAPPILESWGYNGVASGTWIYILSTIWTVLLPILAFVLCFRYYRKAKDSLQIQRRKYVTIGFAIPIAAFISTNIFARVLDMGIPNLGFIATLFFSIFVGYAVVKFDLFTFDAAIAAENILSTMPDALILADLRGRMLKVNERLVNFVGYQEKELIGESLHKLSANSEENNFADVLEELAKKKVIRNQELIFETKAGEKRIILFSGSIVQSKTKHAIGMICIIHDITEHKKIEERLVKTEKLVAIGEAATMVGHDLRNPLQSISNSAYYLKNKLGPEMNEKEKRMIDLIFREIRYSDKIVRNLLDYSQKTELDFNEHSLKEIVDLALSMAIVPNNIMVDNSIQGEPRVKVDVEKMSRVFLNIIQNSCEAMSEGGKLTITNSETDSEWKISFADTGKGFSKEVLEKIGSPFFTTKAKGMGLGLPICHRTVEAHGGTISLKNIDLGANVTITMPFEPKNPQYQVAALVEHVVG